MYHHILIPLENSPADETILAHIKPLARMTGARTDEKTKMGEFANRLWLKILGWTVAGIIIVLNVKLLFDTFMPAAILKAIYRFLGLPAPMQ